MIDLFRTIFKNSSDTYAYDKPAEVVVQTIEALLNRQETLLDPLDFEGQMTGDRTFALEVPSPATRKGKMKFSSTLQGSIAERDGKTVVETKTYAAFGIQAVFVITVLLGVLFTGKGLLEINLRFLFTGLTILVAGPFLASRIADINNGIAEDRYRRYVDPAIRSA